MTLDCANMIRLRVQCVHKLYSYPEFRLNEKKSAYEEFRRG